ncbi:serine hydrolase [Streptomyces sp. NPDC001450]
MIIQKATGQPTHQEIEDRILRPLGLDQTRWMSASPTLPRPHAEAYQFFGPSSRVDVTDQIPVGYENLSWVTTTRDQNGFLRALLSGRLLPARQLAEMKQTVPVSGGPTALARRPIRARTRRTSQELRRHLLESRGRGRRVHKP